MMRALSTLLAPALLIIVALSEMPLWTTFEFDTDEGINLMKAFLYWQGLPLYKEIWNDQPPLLTMILSGWFDVVGPSVVATRLLILLFAALLVWAFHQILQRSLGITPAWIGCLLLILSWSFLKLSVSVMIGLPSLSLAILSLYLLMLYQETPRRSFIILSGVLLALSLQIKLFTVFLIPLFVCFLVFWRKRDSSPTPHAGSPTGLLVDLKDRMTANLRSPRSTLFPILLWISSLGMTYIVIGLLSHSLTYEQLVQPHLDVQVQDDLPSQGGVEYLLSILIKDYDIVLLALLGIWVGLRNASRTHDFNKKYNHLFPVIWFLIAALLLLTHRPIWYHHYLLLSIPMAWLGALGASVATNFLQSKNWRSTLHLRPIKRLIFPGLVIVLLLIATIMVPVKLYRPWSRPSSQWEIVDILKRYGENTQWVFSDRPIIPFYAQLPVPPEVAVLSLKRFASERFTYDDLLNVLKTYRPEQIVLARWTKDIKQHPGIRQYLRDNYSKTFSRVYSNTDKDAIAEHYLINTYHSSN